MKKTPLSKKTFNVTDRAVMLALEFSKIGNTRRLADSQFEVEADKKMIRASKRLLESDELKKIKRVDASVRVYLKDKALPSLVRGGFYMIPNALLVEVDAQLVGYAAQRKARVAEFVAAYPSLIKTAKGLLDKTFNPNDYPTQEDVAQSFTFEWRYVSFGVPAALEKIKAEVFEREQEKASKHWAEATETMQTVLRESMAELVVHMTERLQPGKDGKAKTFKGSTVENLNEFLANFDARNITDDSDLKELVTKAKSLVKGVDPEKLRTDEELRKTMQKGMGELKAKLSKMVTLKPTRKIKFEEDEKPAKTTAAKKATTKAGAKAPAAGDAAKGGAAS